MPMSLRFNLLALAVLFAALLFMARGLVEGKGRMPRGRDRRIAAALFLVSSALFFTAGALLMGGD